MWQVFWLGRSLHLPVFLKIDSGVRKVAFLFLPFGEVRWGRLYSYGDSTGLTPDFPFHPDV